MAYTASQLGTGTVKKKKDLLAEIWQVEQERKKKAAATNAQKKQSRTPKQPPAAEKSGGKAQTLPSWEALVSRHGENAGLMLYDLKQGQKEINTLEGAIRKLELDASNARARSQMGKSGSGTSFDFLRNLAQTKALRQELTRKRSAYNQAKYYQQTIAYEDTVNTADFDKFDDYIPSEDPLHNWINDPSYRAAYEEHYSKTLQTAFQDSPYTARKASPFARGGYDRMNDKELTTYNDYYEKEGKDAARKYLDSIQEKLNERIAEDLYGTVSGNTGLEILFGTAVGVEGFESGVRSAFNTDADYITRSPYEIASDMVREDLADDGFKLPDWLGGASLGQAAYDLVANTSRMAPSVLASVATGIPMVGNVISGLSAAGSAYADALNEGFDKDQARDYSTLVSVAEVVLERILGGISAYGGNKLGKAVVQSLANADKALKMVAKLLGGMASEFSEEYLQTALEPVFRNIMLKTDEKVDVFSPEALYSGILAALSGVTMEIGDIAVNGIEDSAAAVVDRAKDAEAMPAPEKQKKAPAYWDPMVALARMKADKMKSEAQARADTIGTIQGISRDDAASIIGILENTVSSVPEMDALGAREAYLYGYYGIPDDLMTRLDFFYSDLPDSSQQAIYDIGRQARNRQLEQRWQKTKGKMDAALQAKKAAAFEAEESAERGAEDLDAANEAATLEEEIFQPEGNLPVEESAERGIINAGAMGAYNEKNDPDGSKSDAHANRYYESVRNSKKAPVVDTISRNTGISTEEVSKMFDHLFINEYDLEKGHVRFDADYHISESIQRLRDGKHIQKHDLVLIHHEAMEYDLMNKEGLGYDEAHERVNRLYNYQAALKQWLKEQEK